MSVNFQKKGVLIEGVVQFLIEDEMLINRWGHTLVKFFILKFGGIRIVGTLLT